MSKVKGNSRRRSRRFACGALSLLMALSVMPAFALGEESAEQTAIVSDEEVSQELAAATMPAPEEENEVVEQKSIVPNVKMGSGYDYQIITPGKQTTVTLKNTGDNIPKDSIVELSGSGITVSPSSTTADGSDSYTFTVTASSQGVYKIKFAAKSTSGTVYYSCELLLICASDLYDFDIPVICSDMVGKTIQKTDYLQSSGASTTLSVNSDLMPKGYKAVWGISSTTGSNGAIKLTTSSSTRTPPILYTHTGVGTSAATITLTVLLPGGEVLQRQIPVEYEVRNAQPKAFKTTGDVIATRLGDLTRVDLTAADTGATLPDGMSVNASFKRSYDALLTTTTFSSAGGLSIGATKTGVYQVTINASGTYSFSKDVYLIVADKDGSLPNGLFKLNPEKLTSTLYAGSTSLGSVKLESSLLPSTTVYTTKWSVTDKDGNACNIAINASGNTAALTATGSVNAGEYLIKATVTLNGMTQTVTAPMTISTGKVRIDGLRDSYTVPSTYTEYVISAPGIQQETASGGWIDYTGSVTWSCEAVSNDAKSAFTSITTDKTSGYTRLRIASPRKNGSYTLKFTAALASGASVSETVVIGLADSNGVIPTPAPTVNPETPRMGTVNARRVNVRSGAGTGYTALGQVEQGLRISVTGWNNEWYKFTYNGQTAYIKGEFVTLDALPTPTPTATAKPSATATAKPTSTAAPTSSGEMGKVNVTSGSLRLRESPSSSGRVLTNMPAGASVQILEESGDWYKVKYSSTTGYCSKAYIIRTSTPTTKPTATAKPTATPTATASTQVGIVTLSSSSSRLIVRASASRSASVVTRIYHGTQVIILGSEGEFYKIKTGGYTGYVVKDYVKLSQVPTATAKPTATATAKPTASATYATVVKTGGLPLHETEQGVTVRTIPNYGIVQVLKKYGDWIHVNYEGTTGYVEGKYLKSGIVTPDGTTTIKAKVTLSSSSSLNMRAKASTSANVVTAIPNGAFVNVVERGTTWYKIQYSGATGYCMGKYLTIVG